jgi:hypothetical protein
MLSICNHYHKSTTDQLITLSLSRRRGEMLVAGAGWLTAAADRCVRSMKLILIK